MKRLWTSLAALSLVTLAVSIVWGANNPITEPLTHEDVIRLPIAFILGGFTSALAALALWVKKLDNGKAEKDDFHQCREHSDRVTGEVFAKIDAMRKEIKDDIRELRSELTGHAPHQIQARRDLRQEELGG